MFMVEQKLFGQRAKSQHVGTEGTEETYLFIDKAAEVQKETRGLLSINEKISELYDRAGFVFLYSQTEGNFMTLLLLPKRVLDYRQTQELLSASFIEDVAYQRVEYYLSLG